MSVMQIGVRQRVQDEFRVRYINLPVDFDIKNLEKYCKKQCSPICKGDTGIEKKCGIFLWQLGFCKGPYEETLFENNLKRGIAGI